MKTLITNSYAAKIKAAKRVVILEAIQYKETGRDRFLLIALDNHKKLINLENTARRDSGDMK